MLNKYFTIKEAVNKRRFLKEASRSVVFTNGCFDLIHAGHVQYLQQAKSLGNFLIIGINSDESVKKLKGPKRPLVSQQERIIVLSAFEFVDMIVVFDQYTPETLIEAIKPDIHVKGGDYKKEDLPEYDIVSSYGGLVEILPFRKGCSTSGLVEKIVSVYSN
ncbi:MAG: D-glycero-beta-D-manno-heptose 1-phosphate adenylyltransferase [bacterium]|nr:D-glycero-beta-D-manno-heptose 1-phosphate adenylyltransferase [bacterium]